MTVRICVGDWHCTEYYICLVVFTDIRVDSEKVYLYDCSFKKNAIN